MKKTIKLNLGCGNDIKKGYINIDKYPKNKDVMKLDLDNIPFPFKDNSIDCIYMEDTFEHLNINRFDFMRELHRILKPDGIIKIIVPTNSNSVSHTIHLFEPEYFEILSGRRNIVNEKYYNMKFKDIKIVKNRIPLKNLIYRVKDFLDRFLYSSYEFELKK